MNTNATKQTPEMAKPRTQDYMDALYIERDRLRAENTELADAAACALEFIESFKSCVPDWRDRLKVDSEGYSAKLRAALAGLRA